MSAEKHRTYFLLQRAAHLLKREADTALAQAGGMTAAQAAVMAVVAARDVVSQREVAESLSQRESAISAMTLRLLKAGYVKRRRSRTDARAWDLAITEAGLQALKDSRATFRGVNETLEACLANVPMDLLAAGLRRLIDELERGAGDGHRETS